MRRSQQETLNNTFCMFGDTDMMINIMAEEMLTDDQVEDSFYEALTEDYRHAPCGSLNYYCLDLCAIVEKIETEGQILNG